MRLEGPTALQVDELPSYTLRLRVKWTWHASIQYPELSPSSNVHILHIHQGVQYTIVAAFRNPSTVVRNKVTSSSQPHHGSERQHPKDDEWRRY